MTSGEKLRARESWFQDGIREFGFSMTGEKLVRVSVFCSTWGRQPLTETPGISCADCGKQKESYWNYMIAEQCVNIMDSFEVLYPEWQLVMEVDQISESNSKKTA